jgi:hypothetical protein
VAHALIFLIAAVDLVCRLFFTSYALSPAIANQRDFREAPASNGAAELKHFPPPLSQKRELRFPSSGSIRKFPPRLRLSLSGKLKTYISILR